MVHDENLEAFEEWMQALFDEAQQARAHAQHTIDSALQLPIYRDILAFNGSTRVLILDWQLTGC